jgi:hypothetical protein
MNFYGAHNLLLRKPQPRTQPEGAELHIIRRFYTYFGWFPWGDFEGESIAAGVVHELTGGPDEESELRLR